MEFNPAKAGLDCCGAVYPGWRPSRALGTYPGLLMFEPFGFGNEGAATTQHDMRPSKLRTPQLAQRWIDISCPHLRPVWRGVNIGANQILRRNTCAGWSLRPVNSVRSCFSMVS